LIDSIIGALGLGDIGVHFPDTDIRWKGASSIDLLTRTLELMRKNGYKVLWIDSTVIAERPALQPFISRMKENISRAGIPLDAINIKAKTNEGMGPIGRGEGIAAQAVCLLGAE
jgi:2-C-methyl-D-erythritol 2,4-cyclodiphosphate synthase